MEDKKENKESYSKLSEVYCKYDGFKDEVSLEFIKELKKDSKTYGDILNKLSKFERNFRWSHKNRECESLIFIQNIKTLIYKEMSDLPLTDLRIVLMSHH